MFGIARLTRAFSVLVLLCAVPQPIDAQTEPAYEVSATKNVMVAMRDGVKLATDIYRPAKDASPVEGKFPVVLERTPYNKDGAANGANYLVRHGYIVVLQDVRGRYRSEGHWRPIRDDPNDGFDTAKWIGEQSWSDGNIGAMGRPTVAPHSMPLRLPTLRT